jgi:hypothetical protein
MRKLFMASALAGALIGAVTTAPAATAATTTASCSASGHNLNASADYSTSGSYHRWSTARYSINGSGTGGKSNVNIRLRANGVQKWAYDSPDDLDQNTAYSHSMGNTATLASQTEYILFRGIFDTAGSDPACNAYTPNI